jgi:hypothetical protein
VSIQDPIAEHFLFAWADNFLPAWNRMCWRAGIVPCAGYRSEELALDHPDEHIPWHLPAVHRLDLTAAGNLLTWLPLDGGKWNVARFAGALWDEASLRLVIPLPAWGEVNDLAALRPLVSDQAMGFVEKLDMLPMHYDPLSPEMSDEALAALKGRLARTMMIPQFAVPENIGIARDIGPAQG